MAVRKTRGARIIASLLVAVWLLLPWGAGSATSQSLEDAVLAADWPAVIERVRRDDPQVHEPIARQLIAQAYVATNKNNEALLLWLSASGDTDIQQWGEWTAALVGRHPSQPMALYLRADALARAQDLAAAQALLSEAITRQPDFGLAYNARGVIAVLRGHRNRAQVDFHLATQVAPQLADAWANLGTLGVLYEYSLQQGEEALTAFNNAIARNPAFALAYNGRGALYFGAGAFDKAAQDFVAAVQLLPPLLVAEVNKALTFHYALQTVTLAGMAEDTPGTSLRVLMQQYPEALKRQAQQLRGLSSHQTLLQQDFAFRPAQALSALVKQYGPAKTQAALGYDWQQLHGHILDYVRQMDDALRTIDVKRTRPLASLDVSHALLRAGYSSYHRRLSQSPGWGLHAQPRVVETLPEEVFWALPTSEELQRQGRALREGAVGDFVNNLMQHEIGAVVPSWAQRIWKVYSLAKHFLPQEPPETPAEALGRLSPLAAAFLAEETPVEVLGMVLLPFLKAYYGLVLETLGSIDVASQGASVDQYWPEEKPTSVPGLQRIEGYYIPPDRPLPVLAALVAKVVRDFKRRQGPPPTALLIAGDPFRTSLLQTQLLFSGVLTRTLPATRDVKAEATTLRAAVILGVQPSAAWKRRRAALPPPLCPPFCDDSGGGGAAVAPAPAPPALPGWEWGKPFVPGHRKGDLGGISTEELARAFVDKGNWPVMTAFGLLYGVRSGATE
jgi:tetratricopeptide (TPR) repeat protein